MKFRATFSDGGLSLLEKGFLPCLEKHGKTCTLLAGPEDLHLVQYPVDTDGMHITARWAKEMLFDPASYKCVSRHNNWVAVSLDVSLMLRVLRSAHTNAADTVEMKLCMRTISQQAPASVSGQEATGLSKPFLAFSSAGYQMNMVQDMPVSKPLLPAEIDQLNQEKDVSDVCPFYLDLKADIPRLQPMVDKLKSISSTATLVTTKHGHLHLQASGPAVHVAAELQGLPLLPCEAAANVAPLTARTAEGRLQQALHNEDALAVTIQLKHLARTLHTANVLNSGQALCGIEAGGGYVHFMFVFADVEGEGGYDDRVNLSCKLPVRAED